MTTTCTTCGRAQPEEHVLEDRCVGCSLAVRQTILQRMRAAVREPVSVAAEETRYAAQRHLYRTMDPVPAPAPENHPC